MENIFEKITHGIIVEVDDINQAIEIDKHAHGVFVRNFDIEMIEEIKGEVSLPLIASCRVGHFVEAMILEKIGVDIIDESEPGDIEYIKKKDFSTPFICKVNSIEEADDRIEEGAKILRTDFGEIEDVLWLIKEGKERKLKALLFASLEIASPADIALLFQMGADGIIISSNVFRSSNPPKLLDSIVNASSNYNNIEKLVELSRQIKKILPPETK
ncbi:MAG: hypothetical protein H5T44_01355 [Thermoplasmatales archaeon]|nr:hypothetical protein [Thermoplasmatales archaeon]